VARGKGRGPVAHDPDPRFDDRAVCRNHPVLPPDAWFAENPTESLRLAVLSACRRCPLVEGCGTWAIGEIRLVYGTFGGLSGPERARERRRMNAEARAQIAAEEEAEKALTAARLARLQRKREQRPHAERLRRRLGISAEADRKRYAADPQRFRDKASSYYEAHKIEINAARRARRKQASAA
jgi:hypothetical protein